MVAGHLRGNEGFDGRGDLFVHADGSAGLGDDAVGRVAPRGPGMGARGRDGAIAGADVSDRGSAPVELAAGFGLLVLPIAIAVLLAPGWLAGRDAARTAAQSAASVIATGVNGPTGESSARAVAEQIVRTRSVTLESVELCPPRGSCLPLQRGAVVEVVVRVRAEAVHLPGLVSFGAVVVEESARASIDPYRSLP